MNDKTLTASKEILASQDPLSKRMQRPFGLKAITVLLVLQILTGLVIVSTFLLANSEFMEELRANMDGPQSPTFFLFSQPVLLVLRCVTVVGLWRMRRWAWFLMMVLLAYSLALDAVAFLRGDAHYTPMILNVAMVFYLNQHDVQDLFIRRSTPRGT